LKKKQIGIIVMAVLLVGLLAVYFSIMGKWTEDDTADTGEDEQSYAINTVDATTVNGISYTSGGVEYSFTLDGSEWKYDADEKFPVNSETLADMAGALADVQASKVLDGVDINGAEYGMDKPAHVLKLKTNSGAVYTYRIGNYNRHSSLYYLSYEGSDKLYMVSSAFVNLFGGELEDLLLLDTMDSINTSNVTSIKAEGKLGTITLEITDGEDGAKVYTHTNVQGGVQKLEEEAAKKILSALCSVKLTKCADYYAEDGELENFGLDGENRTKITVSYTAKITTTSESTGATSSTNMKKECVYYIGKVLVDREDQTNESNGADTQASSSEPLSAQTSSDTVKDEVLGGGAGEESTDKVEKTYLMLEDSHMVFDVDISSADVFFD